MKARKHTLWSGFVLAAFAVVLVDCGTRMWARSTLPLVAVRPSLHSICTVPDDLLENRCHGVPVPVLGSWVEFRLSHNRGSAFGLFSSNSDYRLLHIICTCIVSFILLDIFRHVSRSDYRKRRVTLALGCIAGVAATDVVEAVRDYGTTQFILLRFGLNEFPVFNVGDVVIFAIATYIFLALSVLQTQRPYWTRRLSSFRNLRAGGGTVLRLVSGFGFSFGLSLLGQSLLSLILLIRGDRVDRTSSGEQLLLHVGLGLASLVLLGAAQCQLLGRRMQQPRLFELQRVDRRPPVLLLRSFRGERTRLRRRSFWARFAVWRPDYLYDAGSWTFERALTAIVDHRGPVIALGSPSDVVQPLGAARDYVSDDQWKARFAELKAQTTLIVVLADDTASVRYEIADIARTGEFDRLLIVVPRQPEVWAVLRADFDFLPEIDEKTVAVQFDRAGTPKRIELATAPRSRWQQLDRLAELFAENSVP
jgi:lipoprotein signal peptidase